MDQITFCTKCGQELGPGIAFCFKCGTQVYAPVGAVVARGPAAYVAPAVQVEPERIPTARGRRIRRMAGRVQDRYAKPPAEHLWGALSLVSGLVGLLVVPIFMGPLGILLAVVAFARRSVVLGLLGLLLGLWNVLYFASVIHRLGSL